MSSEQSAWDNCTCCNARLRANLQVLCDEAIAKNMWIRKKSGGFLSPPGEPMSPKEASDQWDKDPILYSVYDYELIDLEHFLKSEEEATKKSLADFLEQVKSHKKSMEKSMEKRIEDLRSRIEKESMEERIEERIEELKKERWE